MKIIAYGNEAFVFGNVLNFVQVESKFFPSRVFSPFKYVFSNSSPSFTQYLSIFHSVNVYLHFSERPFHIYPGRWSPKGDSRTGRWDRYSPFTFKRMRGITPIRNGGMFFQVILISVERLLLGRCCFAGMWIPYQCTEGLQICFGVISSTNRTNQIHLKVQYQ